MISYRMKKILIILVYSVSTITLMGQISPNATEFEPSPEHPYGRLNPEAPAAVADFGPMIGQCDCRSLSRNPDGTWADTVNMLWKFKYVLNGTAVQDEVWREGNYASSLRQYQADSAQWVVSYYSYPAVAYNPGVWHGSKQSDGSIVLTKEQAAPNGMQGNSVLTFSDISEEGFNWKGEWIKDDGAFTYPFWLIWCQKKTKSKP